MQALLLDVKNYEAFRELVEGNMMSAAEGQSVSIEV
jgi:hypothetical protein